MNAFYFFAHVAWSKFASISFCVPPSPEFASIHDTSFVTFSLTIRSHRSFSDSIYRCHCITIILFKILCMVFQEIYPLLPCFPPLYSPLSSPNFGTIYRSGPWQEAKVCVCISMCVCACLSACLRCIALISIMTSSL